MRSMYCYDCHSPRFIVVRGGCKKSGDCVFTYKEWQVKLIYREAESGW